jgi:hypothetical protein
MPARPAQLKACPARLVLVPGLRVRGAHARTRAHTVITVICHLLNLQPSTASPWTFFVVSMACPVRLCGRTGASMPLRCVPTPNLARGLATYPGVLAGDAEAFERVVLSRRTCRRFDSERTVPLDVLGKVLALTQVGSSSRELAVRSCEAAPRPFVSPRHTSWPAAQIHRPTPLYHCSHGRSHDLSPHNTAARPIRLQHAAI